MGFEPSKMLCLVLLLCCVCVLVFLAAQGRVRASDALRVVVRITSAADRALLPRVRGQLSDVSAELIIVEAPTLEATFADQVHTAQTLSAENAADVVLWFVSSSEHALLVHVATPREERILTRRLQVDAASAPDKPDDALLEAAALAVRSAVIALSAGGSIGVSTREVLANPNTQAPAASAVDREPREPAVPPHVAVHQNEREFSAANSPVDESASSASPTVLSESNDDPAADTGTSARTPLRAQLFIGAQGAIDGVSSYGQQGLYVRAGVGYGLARLSAYGSAALPARIDDDAFMLRVSRHSAGGALDLRAELSDSASLALGMHAGVLLFARSSRAKTSAVMGNPAAITPAFTFGPEAEFALWFSRGFGVGLLVGVDVLPNAPRFDSVDLAQAGGPRSHQVWAFEPRASIGVAVGMP